MEEFKVYTPTSSASQKFNTPVEQKKEFSPTWCEWAAKNRLQLNLSLQIGVAPSNIPYDVPAGFSFFITDINLSSVSAGAGSVSVLKLNIGFAIGEILAILYSNATTSITNQSINYTLPVKVNQGERIAVSAAAGTSGFVAVHGFLEPN